MKNACLVIINENACGNGEYLPIVQAFERSGVFFSELRALPIQRQEAVASAVIDWKNAYENIAIVACGVSIGSVRSLLSNALGKDFFGDTLSGVGVCMDGEKSLFLLSCESAQTGEEYVQSVCVPYLHKKYGSRTDSIVLRTVGADSGWLNGLLDQTRQMCGNRLTITKEGNYGEDIIRIFYDDTTPRMLTDDALRFLADKLSENLYALDDTPLEVQLVRLLKLRGKTIGVAESFTGGGVGRKIVSVSGASDVYFEGLNTYSELSKMRRLGVTEYTLRTQGAVSEQTAYEMAAGLLASGNASVAIATTGLAGPNGDGSGLPIGSCCIAVGVDDKVYVYSYRLSGTREEITETAIRYALFLACKQLKNV